MHRVTTDHGQRIMDGGPIASHAWDENRRYLSAWQDALNQMFGPGTVLKLWEDREGGYYRMTSPIPTLGDAHEVVCLEIDRGIPGPWAGGPALQANIMRDDPC